MRKKKVTLFSGHYGSGKTNLAVNYALMRRLEGNNVTIADLDIVNPYFRTKDSKAELVSAGIRVISSIYANSNLDIPALPKEIYGCIENKDSLAVLDIGGDDRGAYALGRYTPSILKENDYENIFVVNFYRPLTKTAHEAFDVMKEIEGVCGIPFTGIINNSNIGWDTSPEDVLETEERTNKLCSISKLPLLAVAAEKNVAERLNIKNVFPLTLQRKYFDIKEST